MKKLLSLVLVIVLCVGCLSSCAQIKEWTGFDIEGTFNGIKDSVMGALGLGESVDDKLANVKDYLDSQYKSKAEATPADYVVYHVLSMNENGENVKYEVTWTVSGRDGATITDADVKVVVAEDGTTTIDVNEKAEADIPYVLTATIKHPEGKTITTSYDRKVPKFVELTHAQFTTTADDEPVIVKGVIAGIVNTTSKWELYFQDNDGGYYVYGLKQDQVKDLKIGQEVRVSGIKGTYYGVHQVEDASIEVLNATPVALTAKDITADVLAAKDLTVKDVTKYQSMFVTIKGAFITGQVSGDTTYYDFLIGDEMSYLRISGSANMMDDAATTAFKNAYKDATHKDADVSGIVSIYNNKMYLIPVAATAIDNVTTAERTDAEKVAIEELILDAVGAVTEAGNKTLQSEAKTYKDVTFTWSLAETEYATLDGNVLNVPVLPDEAQNITLTLTLTLGETTVVKEYTVRINAAPKLVADTAITVVAGTKYKLVVRQNNLSQVLYWTGENDGNYLVGTTDPTKAADIVAELVDGTTDEYYLYVDINGSRKYINVHDNTTGTSPTVSLDRENIKNEITNHFKYNAELKVFTVDVVVLPKNATETVTETRYFGCYNQYDTFSLSNISYITGGNAANVGVTQFPAYFATLIDTTAKTDAEMVEREKNDLVIDTEYKFDTTINLPANGQLFGKVLISWAAAENNDVVVISGGVMTITPTDEATTVVVTATLTLGDATETKTFEITAQRPNLVPQVVTSPVAGTAYKLFLNQGNLGKTLYFTGAMNGFYFATTENYLDAVDVVLEEATGGFYLTFTSGAAKKYIAVVRAVGDDGAYHTNVVFVDAVADASVFAYNTEHNTFVTGVVFPDADNAVNEHYLGTYNNYNTISASLLSKISTSFPVQLATMVDKNAISDDVKADTTKNELSLPSSVIEDKEIELPAAGETYTNVLVNWALTEANAAAVIEDGKLKITLQSAATTVKVTATITIGNVTLTENFEISVSAIPSEDDEVEAVKPVVGTDYNVFVNVASLGGFLYFTGETGSSAWYLATSTDIANAAALQIEAVAGVDGAYYLFFMKDGAKTYVEAYERQAGDAGYGKGSIQLVTTTPTSYYTYDETYKTLVVTSADGLNKYYIGTYYSSSSDKVFDTLSCSNYSYLTAENVGVTQFPMYFVAATTSGEPENPTTPSAPSEAVKPVVDTDYNVFVNVESLGGFLYFTGETGSSAWYLATSTDIANAAALQIEAVAGVDGAYYLFFMKDGTKTYVEAYERQAGDAGYGKGSIQLVTTTPTSYYTYDETYKTLVVTSADGLNKYYIGTYYSSSSDKVFDTLSCSNYSYLTAENVGVTQFPMYFVAATTSSEPDQGGDPVDPNPNPGEGEEPAVHTCADADGNFVCDTTDCGKVVEPAADSVLTIEQAIALATLYINENGGSYTTGKYYVTGTIKAIVSTTYGQMTLVDASGNEFGPYNTYSADGSTRYDAMEVKPVKGDTVTIYGQIGSYYSTIQMNSGARITAHTAHDCDWADATCEAPSTCTICGDTTGDKTDHVYVDGTCSGCGATEGVEYLTATLAYTDTTTTTNMTGNNDAKTVGLDESVFSVIADKGGSNLYCGLNKAGQIRLYQNANGGNSFTVTIVNGYTIKSIKVTFGTKIGTCAISVDDTVVSTCTTASTTVEVDVNSDNFKLQNTHSTNEQVWVTSIEITYYAG